jgi:hypothetical protein
MKGERLITCENFSLMSQYHVPTILASPFLYLATLVKDALKMMEQNISELERFSIFTVCICYINSRPYCSSLLLSSLLGFPSRTMWERGDFSWEGIASA